MMSPGDAEPTVDQEVPRAVDPESWSAGSTWRRWDPHVHLPGTARNDQFGDMTVAGALDLLASREPTIEVVGVTDYCTTDSFRRALDAWNEGAGGSISLLFPNVELRLATGTVAGSGVNVHLLCAPEDVDELDRFLENLEFTVDGDTYRATRSDLVRLGRNHRGDRQLDEDAAFSVGVNQFKVDLQTLRSRAKESSWFRSRCLVAVASGQGDGTSGVRAPDGGFEQLRQEIERLADIIFSGNPSNAAFWLGQSDKITPEELRTTRGGLKPCIHGSDAHSADELGVPDEDRFCWINGASTFESLRMACLSPATRVRVGPSNPAGSAAGRIVSLSVDAPWFANRKVPINSGLVAIIGPRGSGKTALADLIAAGAGALEPFTNQRSFLARAKDRLEAAPTTAVVSWVDGDETEASLGSNPADDPWVREPVRYLSQQFVDELCAADGISSRLLEEIERVVFEARPREERQGATSFQELLDARIRPALIRMDGAKQSIERLNAELADLRALCDKSPALTKEAQNLEERLGNLDKSIATLTGKGDAESARRFTLVSQALEHQEAAAQAVERRTQALQSLQAAVRSHAAVEERRVNQEWPRTYGDAGLTADEWTLFRLRPVGDPDAVLADALRRAAGALKDLQGDLTSEIPHDPLHDVPDDDLRKRTIAELRAERARLQNRLNLDERRADQLRQAGEDRGKLASRLAQVNETLEDIEKAPGVESTLIGQRRERYAEYFDALLEQERHLTDLYAPLVDVLGEAGGTATKLEFSVRRIVDFDSWARTGEALVDLRRGQRLRGAGSLAALAETALLDVWRAGTGDEVAAALTDFNAAQASEMYQQARRAEGETPREWGRRVADWLFSLDHVSLSYSLRYDGVEIERLSPGTRGIVLLLLYLAIDRQETDPLLIDQPEENLDPESVYTELVKLFRSASTRRQIIMVTHNANLVVNTDVDQVIVARADHTADGELPRLSYRSGGMEDPEIRRAVCEVLEGGEAAFRERARRLGLEWHG